MNLSGNRIYLSNNWGGMLTHREVFVIELPDDWDTYLNSLYKINPLEKSLGFILFESWTILILNFE